MNNMSRKTLIKMTVVYAFMLVMIAIHGLGTVDSEAPVKLKGTWTVEDDQLILFLRNENAFDILIEHPDQTIPFVRLKWDDKCPIPPMKDGYLPPSSLYLDLDFHPLTFGRSNLMIWLSGTGKRTMPPSFQWAVKIPKESIALLNKNPDALLELYISGCYTLRHEENNRCEMAKINTEITFSPAAQPPTKSK